MVVLALLAAITAMIGAGFSRQAARETRKAAEVALKAAELVRGSEAAKPSSNQTNTPAGTPIDTSLEDNPALLAVIAAAIHTVIGERPHRIISIRPGGPGWAQEGRRQIFSSHQTR
jgi:Na+-transporting methylmalonyl-CoA/oxaloacetate decarboxylase gamma subunit